MEENKNNNIPNDDNLSLKGDDYKNNNIEPIKEIVDDISNRLNKQEVNENRKEKVVNSKEPNTIDITKLSREQIQGLKAMLASTPDTQSRKKSKPVVKLRKIDGKIVVDFKNAYIGLVNDVENRREVERHLIPIKFEGEKEYHNVIYSAFINAEQVNCDVISTRNEVEEIIEGEVFSKITGSMVEMVRKEVKNYFTVVLPDGKEIEVEAKLANS